MPESYNPKREYLHPPEEFGPDYIVYLLEKVSSLATDFQLEPLQTVINISPEGVVDRASLFNFVHELEARLERDPMDDAEKMGKLKFLAEVLSILEEDYDRYIGS